MTFLEKSNLSNELDAQMEHLLLSRIAFINRKAKIYDAYDGGKQVGKHSSVRVKTGSVTGDRKQNRGIATAIRGLALDIRRRIFKKAVPKEGLGEDEEFAGLHKRVKEIIHRSNHIIAQSPTVHIPAADYPVDLTLDFRGRRLPLSNEVESAARGRVAPYQPLFIKCTGPKPSDPGAIWTNFELRVARQENLHRSFTEAILDSRGDDNRRPTSQRRFEDEGEIRRANDPQQRSIGRWRPGEARRPDRPSCAVRVPWFIAEFNPRLEKGRRWCMRQARGLIALLSDLEMDPSDIVVVRSVNGSIQIRIPDGVVGAPIFRNSHAAAYTIKNFFDDICSTDTVVREAIDDRLFHPSCLTPVIGSTDPETGRRIVGTDGQTFLESPGKFLFVTSDRDFKYASPEDCPAPRQANFLWFPFLHLGLNRRTPDHKHAGGARDGEDIGFLIRQNHSPFGDDPASGSVRSRVLNGLANGVAQGEKWGTLVDPTYTGQERAALFVANDRLQARDNPTQAWHDVKGWNQLNSPPLPEDQLRSIFEEVKRSMFERLLTTWS